MVRLYTIGFAGRHPRDFFETLRAHDVRLVADVRRNNTSQLAGFTKRGWIEYFLERLAGADYRHLLQLAPDEELLKAYRDGAVSWEQYKERYISALRESGAAQDPEVAALRSTVAVLLCSEREPDRCHRRLAGEYLQAEWGDVQIVHL